MCENTQRPEPEHSSDEEHYWNGYKRGLKDTAKTFASIIEDYRDRAPVAVEGMLDDANRELGFRGSDRIANEG